MRILHLVYGARWTGPAAVAVDQVRALRAAGIEADIAFVAPGGLADRLAGEGWARPLLAKTRWPSDFLADAERLRETVRRERIEMIHSHHAHDHLLAVSALPRRGPSAPVLIRSIHHERQVRRDPLTRALFRKTRAFGFSNTVIARRFVTRYRVERPIEILPPVVDAERFRPGVRPADLAESFRVPGDRMVALTIGKIAAGRGHQMAIEALAAIPGSEAVLLHVGKGDARGRMEELTGRLGVADRNIWAGYQEARLPDLYRLADVFLFTAAGSDRGHRAILEAMASGLPVVALKLPGVEDLVRDGREGLIAATRRELPLLLARLTADSALREQMGAAARIRALEFSAARFAERAIAFYLSVGQTSPQSITRHLCPEEKGKRR
jgi:glycosyltransferase involved in cell wall biosynthesis